MKAQPDPSHDDDRLVLAGELTIYTAAETLTRLRAHLAEHRACALDLSAVTELDGAGLQLLLWLQAAARARGGTLRLVAPSPAVAEVLGLLQLAALFEIEAVNAAAGGVS